MENKLVPGILIGAVIGGGALDKSTSFFKTIIQRHQRRKSYVNLQK